MTDRVQRVVWPALGLTVVVLILAALGTWQVRRLVWKQALIARVAERIHAAPTALPAAAAIADMPDEGFEYRHVVLTGTLAADQEAHVFATVPPPVPTNAPAAAGAAGGIGGPGWFVLSPLTLADGGIILVNRGFVPDAAKDAATRGGLLPAGPLTATGLLRGRDAGNLFTPAADPARNRFYLRDPAVLAAALKLDPARVYPVTVDLDAAFAPPGGLPRPGLTQVTFTTNHLGYALTWYGLMLTALGVGAVFLRARWRAPG